MKKEKERRKTQRKEKAVRDGRRAVMAIPGIPNFFLSFRSSLWEYLNLLELKSC
jgi:hypothetical protein